MKIFLKLVTICCILGVFYGCKSSKNITDVEGSTKVEIPLSGKEYQTDEDYFRARQSGLSPNLSMAKKIALQNAKAELAGNIQSTVESFF